MSETVICVEDLSKSYQLGVIGTGTFYGDLKRWWARQRGKPDPFLKVNEVDSSSHNRETIWALQDVKFSVKQGEALGIIGRNGAGKSTLLKILSRVTAPTSGVVKVKGHIASLLEVGTGFHPELTGRENIYLNGAILGMSRNDIRRKYHEIVEFSGVEKFIDTPVKRYSSGMYVRLAFAVAAHLDPDILIIDEVLAVGDIEFQKRCLGKMDEVTNSGRTILFVSHSMPMISSMCNRCILLQDGRVLKEGPTSEVVVKYQSGFKVNSSFIDYTNTEKRPGDRFVNLLSGWVEKTPGQPQVEFDIFDPVRVCMKFRVLEKLSKAPQPNLHFVDSNGNYVFVTSPQDWQYDISLSPGDYTAVCEVPAHFLNDGMYSVGLAMNCLHDGLHTSFFEQNALSFNVVDRIEQNPERAISGWGGRVPGVVRPLLSWKLEEC
jgi:lipopolysaccharide transport system ATP-binding protein